MGKFPIREKDTSYQPSIGSDCKRGRQRNSSSGGQCLQGCQSNGSTRSGGSIMRGVRISLVVLMLSLTGPGAPGQTVGEWKSLTQPDDRANGNVLTSPASMNKQVTVGGKDADI